MTLVASHETMSETTLSAIDSGRESPAKKQRKPYTLTKKREVWTSEEKSRFVEGLSLYHKDWKKIEQYVGTKTVVQIRSHAQKYFQKLQKTQSRSLSPVSPPAPNHYRRIQRRNSMSAFIPAELSDYEIIHTPYSGPSSPALEVKYGTPMNIHPIYTDC